MNGIPCDFPKCKRQAEHLEVEIESCDESIAVVANLCGKHNDLAYRYGAACESEDQNRIKALETEILKQTNE